MSCRPAGSCMFRRDASSCHDYILAWHNTTRRLVPHLTFLNTHTCAWKVGMFIPLSTTILNHDCTLHTLFTPSSGHSILPSHRCQLPATFAGPNLKFSATIPAGTFHRKWGRGRNIPEGGELAQQAYTWSVEYMQIGLLWPLWRNSLPLLPAVNSLTNTAPVTATLLSYLAIKSIESCTASCWNN